MEDLFGHRKLKGGTRRTKNGRGCHTKAGRTRAMSRGAEGRPTTTLDRDYPRTHTRQNGPTSSSSSPKVDSTKIQ